MLGRIALEAAERFGDRTAYVSADGWELSYRELAGAACEVGGGLRRRGLAEGDVVALVLPTVPDYVVAYVGAAMAGAVTAGVNARLTPPERSAVLARARPRLVIAAPGLLDGVDVPGEADVEEVTPASDAGGMLPGLRSRVGSAPNLPDDPARPVAIVFTSGTTGLPKGAVFGGRQLEAITTIDTGNRWGGGGATYAGTSFAHLGPMTKLPGVLHRGGTTYLLHRWRASDALRLVAQHRMAGIGGIPTQVALMLRHPDFGSHDLSCVKAIVMGGGPATPDLVGEARRRFGAAVAIRYSCTEAGIGTGTAFDGPEEDAEVSVGRPQPGVELQIIVGSEGAAAPVDAGEVGEVCLRSAAVMSGYHGDPEATAAAFTPDGFVRTGDLGWVDDRGRLRLVGRAREMYVRGGYNVYPMEVEGVLAAHPAVAEVAVVPRADDVMGEVGVAVVVPRDPVAPPGLDELREFAAARLARHKLPEDMKVVDSLPLTAMEKVDRRAVARMLADRAPPE